MRPSHTDDMYRRLMVLEERVLDQERRARNIRAEVDHLSTSYSVLIDVGVSATREAECAMQA